MPPRDRHGAAVVHPLCHVAMWTEPATPMRRSHTPTSTLPSPEASLAGLPTSGAPAFPRSRGVGRHEGDVSQGAVAQDADRERDTDRASEQLTMDRVDVLDGVPSRATSKSPTRSSAAAGVDGSTLSTSMARRFAIPRARAIRRSSGRD